MACIGDCCGRGTGLPTRESESHGSGDPCHHPAAGFGVSDPTRHAILAPGTGAVTPCPRPRFRLAGGKTTGPLCGPRITVSAWRDSSICSRRCSFPLAAGPPPTTSSCAGAGSSMAPRVRGAPPISRPRATRSPAARPRPRRSCAPAAKFAFTIASHARDADFAALLASLGKARIRIAPAEPGPAGSPGRAVSRSSAVSLNT